MSLRVKVDQKQVEFNGLLLNIPKLSLSHYAEIEKNNDIKGMLDSIVKTIKENPTSYEYKYIMLQLSAYNGFMKESIVVDNKEYFIENVYHRKPRDFYIGNERVVFEDKFLITAATEYDVIKQLCVSHTPDQLPAYCLEWAYELLDDLAIDIDDKTIIGFDKIEELFSE